MQAITKSNLPIYVSSALRGAGIDQSFLSELSLLILQSRSIDLSPPIEQLNHFKKFIVIGGSGNQAIRTSGNLIHVFNLSGVLLSAISGKYTAISALVLLISLLNACSVNLTPEQAAFFIAAKSLEKGNIIPTAKALAHSMGTQLNNSHYSSQNVIDVAGQLKNLGINLTIGDSPNNVIRHSEWTISVPGF